jgi:hypothetical protein
VWFAGSSPCRKVLLLVDVKELNMVENMSFAHCSCEVCLSGFGM